MKVIIYASRTGQVVHTFEDAKDVQIAQPGVFMIIGANGPLGLFPLGAFGIATPNGPDIVQSASLMVP